MFIQEQQQNIRKLFKNVLGVSEKDIMINYTPLVIQIGKPSFLI